MIINGQLSADYICICFLLIIIFINRRRLFFFLIKRILLDKTDYISLTLKLVHVPLCGKHRNAAHLCTLAVYLPCCERYVKRLCSFNSFIAEHFIEIAHTVQIYDFKSFQLLRKAVAAVSVKNIGRSSAEPLHALA